MNAWILRHFFQILLLAVCVSQWVTAWWLLDGGAWLPWWSLLPGAAVFYAINTLLVRRPSLFGGKSPAPGIGMRVYFGYAFSSVFIGVFLLLASATFALWNGVETVLLAQTTAHLGSSDSSKALFHSVTYAGSLVIGLSFLYGYTIGQRRLRVHEIAIPVRGLPADLAGLRIAQISDVHMGQNLDPEQLQAYVERINDLGADLICATGDLIDSPRADMDLFLPIFAGLRARYGVFAILGNHDHSAGAERVSEAIRRHTTVHLLRDEHAPVTIGDAELHVIGLDDRGLDWARGLRYDPILADLAARVPDGAPAILLNHRPDLFDHAADLRIALTLSGHTHGGQIAMPWITGSYLNPSRFVTPYDRGLYSRDGCHLYTNCGLGVTSQRVRICTPREISVFRLEPAET